MIYFAQSRFGGPIKIGFSTDPEARLKALRTASAEPLILLALRQGDRSDEAELHDKFSPWRLSGEWHEPNSSLLVSIICCDRVAPLVKYPRDLAYRIPPMILVKTVLDDGAECHVWRWTARCTFFEAEGYHGHLERLGRKETDAYKALTDLYRLAHDETVKSCDEDGIPSFRTDEVLIGPYLTRAWRERTAWRQQTQEVARRLIEA